MGKLFKNFMYNSAYQLLTIIIPLITTPYLTRVLGSNSLGISTYVLSIVTLFYTIGSLGMDLYSRREVAYINANKGNLKKIFCELLVSRFFLLFLTFVVYLPFLFNNQYRIFYLINLGTLVGLFFDISWFFIGIEDMKSVVLRNIIIKIGSTISIFAFVNSQNDISIYLIIYSLSQVISCISMYPHINKIIKEYDFEKINLKHHIKPVLAFFLPQAASSIYTQFDKIMIGMLSDDISFVTIYEKADVIIKIPLKFVIALSAVVLPKTAGLFVSDKKEEIVDLLKKIKDITLFLVLPIIVGICLVADIFLPLYLGNEYIGSISVIRILSISVIAIALSNITGIQYLMAINEIKILTFSYTTGAIVNVILNYFFIIRHNANGAAIATVISEWIIFIIQYYYIKRRGISLKLFSTIWKQICSLCIMIITCICIRFLYENTLLSGILQIIFGAFSYFFCVILLKDEVCFSIINKLKK